MTSERNPAPEITQAKIRRLKQRAKQLKKELEISQSNALNLAARQEGFANWKAFIKKADQVSQLAQPTPPPSLKFINDEDVTISDEDVERLKNERHEDLSDVTKLLLIKNRTTLAKKGIEYSLFEPTATGLTKSILDATQPVRTHFQLTGFHNYDAQGQGNEHKVITEAYFVSPESSVASRMSMYRPKTKNGDPRMWFSNLGSFAPAGSQVAIIIFDGSAYLLNITTTDLADCIRSNDNVGLFLNRYTATQNEVASELLNKLKEIAKKPLPALGKGDTAVGMAIEAALGIAANSCKEPDYNGIELKSGRGKRNRKTLFAQVADWSLSACKSSAEILEKYGYDRGHEFKLYCTISTQKANSQGLKFEYCSQSDLLKEKDINGNDVALWTGNMLRNRLREKHAETFWIQADSIEIDGIEHFQLKSVVHTKSPIVNQLMPLVESGVVTMDHLIKKSGGEKPKVSEKGPLFKISERSLSLLFPDPVSYSLLE